MEISMCQNSHNLPISGHMNSDLVDADLGCSQPIRPAFIFFIVKDR